MFARPVAVRARALGPRRSRRERERSRSPALRTRTSEPLLAHQSRSATSASPRHAVVRAPDPLSQSQYCSLCGRESGASPLLQARSSAGLAATAPDRRVPPPSPELDNFE
eukprot:Amastigsp_a4274_44.p3 type:complete len:110 gc:universal Amastigsp_a4274_44:661-332(-)